MGGILEHVFWGKAINDANPAWEATEGQAGRKKRVDHLTARQVAVLREHRR